MRELHVTVILCVRRDTWPEGDCWSQVLLGMRLYTPHTYKGKNSQNIQHQKSLWNIRNMNIHYV